MTDNTLLQRQPVFERRLENGLTVIVREDHSAPVVAVVTHVKAGYFDEPDTLIGISHVLEHMYFKGTERRGPGEIARETKEAGGYLNAGTIYDHTSYYTVLPSDSLEQALDIQADALQRSAIDEDELKRELQVIIQEARRKLDNPGAVARETLFETMFDVHRIRRWRIGHESILSRFTRDDVWRYYRNLYRASNTIVVIAGDVDPERAFNLAEKHYGGMDAGNPVRDSGMAEPLRRGFRYREMSGDIAQSQLELGWRTHGPMHEDTAALDVLATALGQGRASRLYRHVRDAGHVASVSSWNYTPGDVGVFSISAELDPADTDAALRAIAAVIADVRQNGLSADEVERARNVLEARMLRRLETAEGQANVIAEWQALGDWRLADTYLARIMAVTAEQLHDVARRYLDPGSLTMLLYRPHTAPEYAADAARLYVDVFEHASAPALEPASAPSASAPAALVASRLKPVQIEDGVRFYVVDGVAAHIIVKPRTTTPLVSMALACRGGILSESPTDVALTGWMMRTSVKGTRTRSGAQLALESEALGGSISPSASVDMLDWNMSVPSRHFDRAMELLLDAALDPAFRVEDAELERKVTLSGLEHLRDDMHQYPLRLALAAAFPDHPYSLAPTAIEASLRRLDPAALRDWHERRALHGAPNVFIVGDIADPDEVAGSVAAQLKRRIGQPLPIGAVTPTWPERPAQIVEERDKAQTAIALVFPGPPRNHDDVFALQVLSSAISGLGGRLFEELRSRRSLAYTVSATPLPRWLGGAFVAYIGTDPDREHEAREQMMNELLRTTRERLLDDEIERARRYLVGTWQIRQQTHSRQLADLSAAVLLGSGVAELREYADRIRAVSAEQVRVAAERWLRPDRVVEAVIRGTGASPS